jgi:hypothetical protein
MRAERLVGEHACRADLHEIATEFTLQRAFLMAPEIDMVMGAQRRENRCLPRNRCNSARSGSRRCSVHFVLDEGAQILIAMRDFPEVMAPVVVADICVMSCR